MKTKTNKKLSLLKGEVAKFVDQFDPKIKAADKAEAKFKDKKAGKTTAGKSKAKGEAKTPAPKVVKEMPVCKCGCVDEATGLPSRTRGGVFKPGHDARYYAKENGHAPKAKSTGDHLVDTVLGLYRKMDEVQRELFTATLEERFQVAA